MSIDLTTHYGGLSLRSPVVIGACPLTAQEQMRVAIDASGAGAVVLPSLFAEQVLLWNQKNGQALSSRDTQTLVRAQRFKVDSYCNDAETYLSIVRRARRQTTLPVIASLNGDNASHWLDYAGALQEAGASAIELNLRHPPPAEFSDAREIEDSLVNAVKIIHQSISIPLFLKLSREYTSLSHLAVRLLSGIQGLVLFGRSPEVDISLDTLQMSTDWCLTPSGKISHLLESVMRVHAFCPAMPIAACGGVSNATDVIKVLLAGADVAMVSSAVYREGPDIVRSMIDGLVVFMERHGIRSLPELQAIRPLEFNSEEERLDYMEALASRVPPSQKSAGQRKMCGDRWGHLQAEDTISANANH
ncbi:dihydroorotate dehydrogenase [Novipirellula caenicola]|uniref:NAD-dependent dihydropyrimidine dehydrogenase subunit PreA n=1 Tax=Novipirellula caenicola TaxID=1536901 RepID=A0ABP9VRA5_9BACT